jgi:hypothetical protein
MARSLLSGALDEANPDPRHVAGVLDAIPGAWERLQRARDQASHGETVELDEL